MKRKKWLRGLAIFAGVLVVVIAVLGMVSCADPLGSDDDGGDDSDGDGDSDGDSDEDDGDSDVDPRGTWLAVLDEPAEGPGGVEFRAALAEIDDEVYTTIFYGKETEQVAGLRGSYEVVDGDTVKWLMSTWWLPEDPPGGDPELVDEWSAIDWYEVVEDDRIEDSVTIDGTTLYGGEDGEIEFEKVSFSRPDELVGSWVDGEDDVELFDSGNWTFTYGGETGGGPRWEASGTDEGYLRQVYDEMSDDEEMDYTEYLSPHKMPDAETLRFYSEYDLSSENYLEYELSE